MLETITSPAIEPSNILILGSSSTDGEDNGFLIHGQFLKKNIYSKVTCFLYDIASYMRNVSVYSETETFKNIETIPVEMLEHDIFVKMPPKREYTIKAKIIHRCKAEPRIVVPENPYTGI